MVYYFKVRPEAGDYTIYMGLDKHENEDLIRYGFPEDIWFHVDKLSSAHVYLRMHKGEPMESITPELLEDCAQLVKANSIQGNKLNNLDVVYTPWFNLKKTPAMDVGQVGFHNPKLVRTVKVEKRVNEIVNRLNKTKVEKTPDLKAEREAYNSVERAERKVQVRDKKRREEMERLEKERQAEIRSYKGLMVSEKMTSNKDIAGKGKSLQELEDEFMADVDMKKSGRKRLGGKGLSLEAFAAAKTRDLNYVGPAKIKQQKEFYANAKTLSKYNKLKNKHKANVEGEGSEKEKKKKKENRQLKESHDDDDEKQQQQKKEENDQRKRAAEEKRKEMKSKMMKKTSRGQPLMKHRLQHILDNILSQESTQM